MRRREAGYRAEAVPEDFRFSYTALPTLAHFHSSKAFIRAVRGPVGSGKSVGVVVADPLYHAFNQAPDRYQRRRTRWAIIRNTYGELKTTTIKTFQDWLPQEICPIKWDEPITGMFVRGLPDGTRVEAEFIFIAVDRPQHIKKLKSLELTGAVLNEASELDKSILDMVTARVGRFPSKKDGAPLTWCGVMLDTNSMDDDHWYHDLDVGPTDEDRRQEYDQMMDGLRVALKALDKDRPLIEFFEQPPALIEAQGSYVPNPDAENIENQQLGAAYWLQLVAGKPKEWIDMYVLNKYGQVIDGKPVYPEYNEEIHGKKLALRPIPGVPIYVGLDYGLSPAAVCEQVSAKGQLLILGECVAKERSMGFEQFATQALKPYLTNRFGSTDSYGQPWEFRFVGDPTGTRRSEGDEASAVGIGADVGINIIGAKTNAFLARREALAFFMNRLVEGRPALLIDESCRMVRKGLKGGYHYRRVQIVGEARYQDQPYKNKYSHPCLAMGTLVSMPGAEKRIEDVRAGDLVLTPAGARRVLRAWKTRAAAEVIELRFSNGRRVSATADHLIWANGTWMRTDALQYGDVLQSIGAAPWAGKRNTPSLFSTVSAIIASRAATTRRIIRGAASIFIARHGALIKALFRPATTFTTRTAGGPTTTLEISSACRNLNTAGSIRSTGSKKIRSGSTMRWTTQESPRQSGTDPRPPFLFTRQPEKKAGSAGNVYLRCVRTAEKLTLFSLGQGSADFARRLANLLPGARAALMTKSVVAGFARWCLSAIATRKPQPVVTIVGAKRSAERVDVYDLTVQDEHCFYAEGVLVHNCEAAQYAALEHVAIESPSQGMNMTPDWQRKINMGSPSASQPWRRRGHHAHPARRRAA